MSDPNQELISETHAGTTSTRIGSAARLNVLVIHETLPRPDRSGTDVKLMQVLRELREQGHAVTYVGRSGVDRERYSPPLANMGIRVYAHDAARLRYAGVNDPAQWDFRDVVVSEHFDLAILYHWFWTPISISEHYLDAIRKSSPGTRIAILADDQNGLKEEHLAQASGLLSDHLRAADFRQREEEIYPLADLLLSDSDADMQEMGAMVPELRTGALTVTADVCPSARGFAQRNGVLFVGDFSSRINTEGAAWLLQEIWPAVRRQLPKATLYIAGNSSTSLAVKTPAGVHLVGRVEDLGELYEKCRVFAAPTRSCTGVQTKVLGALSHGLPAVTTSITARRLRLVHERGALLADDTDEFARQIVLLHQEPDLWNSLSARAQDHVRKEFSLDKLRAQVRDLMAIVPQITPRRLDPNHTFSVLRVERAYPEAIAHPDPRTRMTLRNTAYLHLGEELLALGKPGEAREQFLHVFPYVQGPIPQGDFFARLLINLVRCDELHGKGTDRYLEAARTCLHKPDVGTKPKQSGKLPRTGQELDVSVIVPTFNRSAILASCLAALECQTLEKCRYEVIVVDDGSGDATEQLCRGLAPGFRFSYFRQENGGAGAARNLGLHRALGKYVLLINDDTIVSPGLLEEHLRAHRSEPDKKFAVLGNFPYPEAAARKGLTYFLSKRPFLFPQVSMKKGFYQGMAYFITCNLSIAREAVRAAGSFDSKFRVGEDTDLGARLTSRGYEVLYWPDACATHDHLAFRVDDIVRRARSYGPATLRLIKKYPYLLADETGPLGRLDTAWRAKTLDFLRSSRPQVEEALAAARRLEDFDFSTLLRGEVAEGASLADGIVSLLEKAVTQIHWFYLLEAIVKGLTEGEVSDTELEFPAQTSSPKDGPPCQL